MIYAISSFCFCLPNDKSFYMLWFCKLINSKLYDSYNKYNVLYSCTDTMCVCMAQKKLTLSMDLGTGFMLWFISNYCGSTTTL